MKVFIISKVFSISKREQYVFKCCGAFSGLYVDKFICMNSEIFKLEIAENYVMLINVVKIVDEIMYGRIIKVRELESFNLMGF